MKRVIHIGEGKHVEIEEGAINAPPPPPPPPPKKQGPKDNPHPKAIRPYNPCNPGVHTHKKQTVPGYAEWLNLRHQQTKAHSQNMGRTLGQHVGMTRKANEKAWRKAEKQVKKDMETIKKAGIDLNAAAEEALEATLLLMRKPGDIRLRLAAARQVLEWTKAKPVAKSEVTINKAEEWLASLAKESDDGSETGADS